MTAVEQGKQDRQAFRGEDHRCPECGGSDLMPCGGPGSYWIEHSCGAFSEMKPTLDQALASTWQYVDPELNVRMHPPVGGS